MYSLFHSFIHPHLFTYLFRLEAFPVDDQYKTLSRLQIIKLPKDIQDKKISAKLKVSKGENAVILEVPKAAKKTEKETLIPINYV